MSWCPQRSSADREYVDVLRTFNGLVPAPTHPPTTTRDADDDYLVALAREHLADVIVSGDKDFLEWREQRPPVLTPEAFERRLIALRQERQTIRRWVEPCGVFRRTQVSAKNSTRSKRPGTITAGEVRVHRAGVMANQRTPQDVPYKARRRFVL